MSQTTAVTVIIILRVYAGIKLGATIIDPVFSPQLYAFPTKINLQDRQV
jgi:hypothetical protein